MKKLLVICILLYSYFSLVAQENKELNKNANAIIEYYDAELTLLSQEKAILRVNIKSQILNKNGNKHAIFFEYYDKFRKIKSFEGKIYNSQNIEVEKIKNKDLIDQSLISNYSLYEDNRVKYYDPLQKKFPYYIEYSYEIEYNGIFNLPTWQPVSASHLSIKNASLKVIQEENNPIRYKLIQIEEPTIETIEDKLIYNWKIENISARKKEPMSLPYCLTSPTVYLAPNFFSIDEYSGSMKTWKEFGKWRYNLIKTQTSLPEEAISDIKNLIGDQTDKMEISKKIYEYMQSRTRYVSIQEGIGGWQPIDATSVHNLGYGDCKALSNYTKALLEVAGIKSHYAVIRAGISEPDIMKDFPSNQFNHAILCIPTNNDTIWLECTSPIAPFGYLGDFTGNKHALLITESGGKIVKTTNYSKENNLQKRTAIVDIKENGQTDANIKTKYSGLQFENISYYLNKSKEDQKKSLLKNLDLNDYTIKNFAFYKNKQQKIEAIDSISVLLKSYTSISGSRIFFNLNMLNKKDYVPVKLGNRISPVRFSYPYTDIDSIEYNIPESYLIEYLPEDFSINNQFGDYSVKYISNDSKVTFVRKLSMNKDIFLPESYNDLRIFFEEISKHDKSKCVLKKKI